MIPFHIVALVYFIVAGQPVIDEPVRVAHKMSFKDEDACQAFLKSDTYVFQRAALTDMMRLYIPKLKDDDGRPLDEQPDTAVVIMASCEEDNSL